MTMQSAGQAQSPRSLTLTGAALALLCLSGMAACQVSSAQSLVNGSFEAPGGDVRQQLDSGHKIPGWTYTPGQGGASYEIYESDDHDGLAAADGKHYVSFGHNGTYGGSISQTFATRPGVTYRVTYFVAEQQEDDPQQVLRAMVTSGGRTVARDNAGLTSKFRAGASLTFKASGSSATLRFLDATPAGRGAVANLALDRVSVNEVR